MHIDDYCWPEEDGSAKEDGFISLKDIEVSILKDKLDIFVPNKD
jgi:hypothetical protein